MQRKSRFVNSQQSPNAYQDLTLTQHFLDDMIGRANEVLNALLRLRKHQIASEQYRSAAAAAASASNASNQYHVKVTFYRITMQQSNIFFSLIE